MSPRDLIYCLYPRLLALHDLDDQIALPFAAENTTGTVDGGNNEASRTQAQMQQTSISLPSCMRNGHFYMEAGGIYLMGMCLSFFPGPSLWDVHLSFERLKGASSFICLILILAAHR